MFNSLGNERAQPVRGKNAGVAAAVAFVNSSNAADTALPARRIRSVSPPPRTGEYVVQPRCCFSLNLGIDSAGSLALAVPLIPRHPRHSVARSFLWGVVVERKSRSDEPSSKRIGRLIRAVPSRLVSLPYLTASLWFVDVCLCAHIQSKQTALVKLDRHSLQPGGQRHRT